MQIPNMISNLRSEQPAEQLLTMKYSDKALPSGDILICLCTFNILHLTHDVSPRYLRTNTFQHIMQLSQFYSSFLLVFRQFIFPLTS